MDAPPPAGAGIGEFREGVEVGVFEFDEGAVFDDEGGDGVFVGEGFEDGDVGAGAGLGAFDDGEFEVVEEDVGELFGGVLVKGFAGGGLDFGLEGFEFDLDFGGEFFEEGGVDHDAVEFHVGEDLDEGHFEVVEERFVLLGGEFGLEDVGEAEGDVGVFGGVLGGAGEGDVGEGDGGFAGADEVGDGGATELEVIGGKGVHAVGEAGGVDDVGGDHGIEGEAGEGDAEEAEGVEVVFEVLAGFFDGGVVEKGGEFLADEVGVEGVFDGTFDGDVEAGAGVGGEGDAAEVGGHGAEGVGFGIDGEEGGERGWFGGRGRVGCGGWRAWRRVFRGC